ncbi:MAG: PASTA domain-containing protein [Candidatus Eisenbacteria bacterium]|nr:PASTA domain-containing protein [Candidatus Eisenbacteria bacterium]
MSEATPVPRRRVTVGGTSGGGQSGSGRARWGKRGLRLLWWGAEIFLGVVLGLGIFDKIVMPKVVRKGADVVVPDVSSQPVSEAIAILEGAELRPILSDGKFSPVVPGGMVLSATPAGGIQVKKGRQVFLVPSLGIESRAVPELAGTTLRIAQTKLRSLGLDVGEIRYAAVGDAADGEVLATSPGPGALAPSDGKVQILMSRLKADVPLRMPELTGRPGIETAAWLEGCGFAVEMRETSFPGDAGAIISQDPPSGAAVYPGTTLVLEVAREADESDEEGLGWRERLKRRFGR